MKKLVKIFLIAVGVLSLASCNDDYLEKFPLNDPTEVSVFATNEGFKAYAWLLYDAFPKLGYGENYTDDISKNWTRISNQSSWIKGTILTPTSSKDTYWDQYRYIRKCNILLANIDAPHCQLTEAEKKHWRSVGLFFRSYGYFKLMKAYGGVPWIDKALNDASPEIFQARNTRDEVAANILTDLQYAEENIGTFDDGINTITLDVIQAFMSRYTLFEGTWRKYHGLTDADKYLNECKRVSAALIAKHPAVHPRYDDLFCSLELKGKAGVLLYNEYSDAAAKRHTTSIMGLANNANAHYEPTKDLVDSYLCEDGKPRWTSPLFQGDKNMYDEFAKRDRRLWLQVCPPFMVNKPAGGWAKEWWYLEDNPAVNGIDSVTARSYIDAMKELVPAELQKSLPVKQGNAGGVMMAVPHYRFMNRKQPWFSSEFGYANYKYYCSYLALGGQRNEETDMPVFRIGETMLNYAEAMCELGEFSQAVADMTINVLRKRGQVAPMVVADIASDFDPTRDKGNGDYTGDYEVNPLLWEVRRERRVELFQEGFRFDDLRRWKKCHYAMKQKKGQWVNIDELKVQNLQGPAHSRKTLKVNLIKLDRAGNEGYLIFHDAPSHLWSEHYYLFPIPLDQLVLNKNLEQNPGWEKPGETEEAE